MFRGFEAESDICPSDQHDLSGEVFSYEGYGTSPLFSQGSEEGVLGHGELRVSEGVHFVTWISQLGADVAVTEAVSCAPFKQVSIFYPKEKVGY